MSKKTEKKQTLSEQSGTEQSTGQPAVQPVVQDQEQSQAEQVLIFRGQELQQLDNLLGKIPLEYSWNLANFILLVRQKRQLEAQQVMQSAEKKSATIVKGRKISSKAFVAAPGQN